MQHPHFKTLILLLKRHLGFSVTPGKDELEAGSQGSQRTHPDKLKVSLWRVITIPVCHSGSLGFQIFCRFYVQTSAEGSLPAMMWPALPGRVSYMGKEVRRCINNIHIYHLEEIQSYNLPFRALQVPSLIPRSHIRVGEGQNQLHRVVLWHPHVHWDTYTLELNCLINKQTNK